MVSYYDAMKRYINFHRNPVVIEVVLCKLSDVITVVRSNDLPYAIVWRTLSGVDGGELWAAETVQHAYGITRGIGNCGDDDYSRVRNAVIEVIDWDILFPTAVESDPVVLMQFLVDETQGKE